MSRQDQVVRSIFALCVAVYVLFAASSFAADPNAGGDEVIFRNSSTNYWANRVLMAEDGTLYGVLSIDDFTSPTIEVWRSEDRGTTWALWSTVPKPTGAGTLLFDAVLAETTISRLHILYGTIVGSGAFSESRHVYADLTSGTPTWTDQIVFFSSGLPFVSGDLAVDAADHDAYRVYAVAQSVRTMGIGGDLWYSRSTDQGQTWALSGVLEYASDDDHVVIRPKIAWGAGRVHVAWTWGDSFDDPLATTNGVRYRSAGNFGASAADFGPMQILLPSDDGEENAALDLVASTVTDDVFLLASTRGFSSDAELWRSRDAGASWNPADVTTFDPSDNFQRLTMNDAGDRLYVAGERLDDPGNFCQGQPVVLRGVLSATSGNLLVNPSFEDPAAIGVEYFGAGDGWTTFGGGVYTVTDAIGPANTGAQSLKLFGSCCSGVFQQFPTTPGESWAAGAWIYNNPADPLAGGQVAAVNIEWIQADGVTQSALLPFVSNGATTAASPQGVWTYQTIQGTAPADAAFARLTLITADFAPGGPGGAPLYDDVSLVRTNPGPTFGAPMIFAPQPDETAIGGVNIALDPSDSDEFGIVWTFAPYVCNPDFTDRLARFDATWRDDPGFPVTEAGFPVALEFPTSGPPTIANLDDDPFDEIAWVDVAGRIHVVNHDGTPVSGWPQDVGDDVLHAAVACGDLFGGGRLELVYGDATGRLHAFDASTGHPLPGFPVTLGTGSVRVTIAPVAAPYAQSIVATVDQSVFVVSYRGEVRESWNLGRNMVHPASVGDLDGDGTPEIVVPSGLRLHRMDPGNPVPTFEKLVDLFTATSGPASLADLDLDGVREILVPMAGGLLRAFEANGDFRWTYNAGTGADVSAVAVANALGNGEPELALASGDEIHLVDHTGNSTSFYPQDSGVGPAIGSGGTIAAPVMNSVQWISPNVIAGTTAGEAWAWVNLGGFSQGWPKSVDGEVKYAAATGDLDGDGNNEIVMLTTKELRVMDVGVAPRTDASGRWAQWGNDAGHSFCYWGEDEALVTSVGDGNLSIAFAPPQPNPSSGRTSFAFSLPATARVRLEVYDLRGRRVRAVTDRGFPAGAHVLFFDGRDANGTPLANGVYLAVLRVVGEGVDRAQTQRITLLR